MVTHSRIADKIGNVFFFLECIVITRLILLISGQKDYPNLKEFFVLTGILPRFIERQFSFFLDPAPAPFWVGPIYFDPGTALLLLILVIFSWVVIHQVDYLRILRKKHQIENEMIPDLL